jgi:hypothetical protein
LDIKRNGLIYLKNGWAIYEGRMMSFKHAFTSIGVKVSHPTSTYIDFKLGMLALIPSYMGVAPDHITMSLVKRP